VVFNSLTFIVFFAVVLLLHRLPIGWTAKKINLLAASYLFYAAWNPPFVVLLMISAVVDFHLARLIGRTESTFFRRGFLIASLALNLALLGYFKYGQFLLDNVSVFLGEAGIYWQPPAVPATLPLGISFYTFETVSYLIDVYRGRITPWGSFLDYSLFLAFFPHLVAGPIVRAGDFLPQCQAPRVGTPQQMGWGFCLLLLGLFEKVILADQWLAPVADKVYNASHPVSFADAWLGTFAFSGQIFFDFAGYSACAIGAALCLGFVLNDNFRFPYAAIGPSDFWRRWHMSLSSWLRDYLYVPLGGNRKGPTRTHVNLMLTMLIGGLWHGASWRFVAWGGLHGLYLMAERALKAAWGEDDSELHWTMKLFLALGTFGLISVSWVFFRAVSFERAFQILSTMTVPVTGGRSILSQSEVYCTLGIIGMLLAAHWVLRDITLEEFVQRVPRPLWSVAIAFALVCLAFSSGADRAFIYFQF
jgi:alginate O-acetyltransferase complex protein AlgI